ncbi:Hypothetical predicted protein [Podarcis lilfordi]|uniref:Uncharacterized protein n=1 Tax=Podarcis lilfordi TaxID=74358 RepID=A0AA35KJW4_9SAUR|nr:Hypothetical predicted protein [Podarcis lilfordi]
MESGLEGEGPRGGELGVLGFFFGAELQAAVAVILRVSGKEKCVKAEHLGGGESPGVIRAEEEPKEGSWDWLGTGIPKKRQWRDPVSCFIKERGRLTASLPAFADAGWTPQQGDLGLSAP